MFCTQTREKTNTLVAPRECFADTKEKVVLYLNLNQSYTELEQKTVNDEINKNGYKVVKTFIRQPNIHTISIVDAFEYCDKHHVGIIVVPNLSHLCDTPDLFDNMITYILSTYPKIKIHSALCGYLIPKAKWCDDYVLLRSLYDAEQSQN